MSDVKKTWSIFLCVVLVLVGAVSGQAVAKQPVTVEIFYSGGWHVEPAMPDAASRVRVNDPITINHGAGSEQSGVVPSDASVRLDDRDGRMNPDNRLSPLFGLIGHNTPTRIKVGSDIRLSGRAAAWKPRMSAGGDAWVDVEIQGTIRRLGQGTPPVWSALRRTVLTKGPAEAWPLEDSTQFTSVVGGPAATTRLELLGKDLPKPGTFTGFPGSAPAASMPPGGNYIDFPVRAYSDTGLWVAQSAVVYTVDMGLIIFKVLLSNDRQVTFGIFDQPNGDLVLEVEVADDSTSYYFNSVTISGSSLMEQPMSLMVSESSASGGSLIARVLDDQGGVRAELTSTGVGYATVEQLWLRNAGPAIDNPGGTMGAGHMGLFTNPAFNVNVDTVDIARAMGGYAGEKAGVRFTRLCTQLGIASTIVGTEANTQPMGPQYPDTDLGLFDEIARTDAGFIHDTRDVVNGLTLRTGRSIYNQ